MPVGFPTSFQRGPIFCDTVKATTTAARRLACHKFIGVAAAVYWYVIWFACTAQTSLLFAKRVVETLHTYIALSMSISSNVDRGLRATAEPVPSICKTNTRLPTAVPSKGGFSSLMSIVFA